MPMEMTRQALEMEELACANSAQVLLRAEAPVPGAGREAIEALMAEASLSIGAVDVQKDRVVVEGSAWCQAVYRQGEESTLRAVTAKAALSHVFEQSGIDPGLPCRVNGQVEHVEVKYENGHMAFYVSVNLSMQVLRLNQTEVISGTGEADGIECAYRKLRSVKMAAENSVDIQLVEEVSLPAALDARMALMDWGSARVDSAVPDLGGIRVKGKVNLETLISSGVEGRPVALIKYPLNFEQLVDLPDWLTEDVQVDATVERLDTRVDQSENGEDAVLRIEASVRLNLQAYHTDEAEALSDAYSTGGTDLTPETREITYTERVTHLRCVEAFRGTLLLPDTAPPVGMVLAARALPNLAEWSSENGQITLSGVLETCVLYMPTGSDRLASARGDLPFTIQCPGELSEDAWLHVEAASADASTLMSDRVELRCDLIVSGETRTVTQADIVQSIAEAGGEARRPGYILFWPEADDDLWSIGKRYRIPVETVRTMNGGKGEVQRGKALVLKI